MKVSIRGNALQFWHPIKGGAIRRGVGRLSPDAREKFVEDLERLLLEKPKTVHEISFKITSPQAFEAYFAPIYGDDVSAQWHVLYSEKKPYADADKASAYEKRIEQLEAELLAAREQIASLVATVARLSSGGASMPPFNQKQKSPAKLRRAPSSK